MFASCKKTSCWSKVGASFIGLHVWMSLSVRVWVGSNEKASDERESENERTRTRAQAHNMVSFPQKSTIWGKSWKCLAPKFTISRLRSVCIVRPVAVEAYQGRRPWAWRTPVRAGSEVAEICSRPNLNSKRKESATMRGWSRCKEPKWGGWEIGRSYFLRYWLCTYITDSLTHPLCKYTVQSTPLYTTSEMIITVYILIIISGPEMRNKFQPGHIAAQPHTSYALHIVYFIFCRVYELEHEHGQMGGIDSGQKLLPPVMSN